MDWPIWWNYKLVCDNPHLQKRMAERHFSEIDLRDMLQRATAWNPDPFVGRHRIETSRAGVPWRVIVEPSETEQQLHVVTAFEV